jgi:GT2 family glycosyltransferase
MSASIRIAVLMTCHNRRDTTLVCLQRLNANLLPAGVTVETYLVDDGSTDGTDEAVRGRFPQIRMLAGNGNLFWNGGMHLAFDTAMRVGFDYYLWLNDDTLLYPSALSTLVETARRTTRDANKPGIVVGSTQDARTGEFTYGGQYRPSRRLRPLKLKPVKPSNAPEPCDTVTGNCVLIPHAVVEAIGNLDAAFVHAMGDTDYGFRASAAGFPIWVMPGFAGTCSDNPGSGGFYDRSLPMRERLKRMRQPKGLPVTPWKIFTRRHAGICWFIHWLWPYFRVIITSLKVRNPGNQG